MTKHATWELTILTALVALCSSVLTTRLFAQDAPLVFQHGLASSGSTWSQTASRLRTELKMAYVAPSTNACKTFETQAGELPAQINPVFGSISGIGFVGHSNGGLVSREFHRETSRNNKIVSVASLHQG